MHFKQRDKISSGDSDDTNKASTIVSFFGYSFFEPEMLLIKSPDLILKTHVTYLAVFIKASIAITFAHTAGL